MPSEGLRTAERLRRPARLRRALLLGVLILLLGACGVVQVPYVKDGKPYGVTRGPFRDQWWHFYERGVSFAEGGYYTEAARDFGEAIRRRAADQWRTRTYGMHFLDYFPHRELGILHYRRGRHEEAIRELEASVSSASSAKAAYFLNRARAATLEQTGADRQPPVLRLSAPPDEAITNEFHTAVSGVATDDQFVSGVSVNGASLLLEQSTDRFEFELRIPLREGVNEIRVRATDLTGKETTKSLTVIADRRGPVITVGDLARVGTKRRLTGYITDETGIVQYSINGKKIVTNQKGEIALTEDLAPGPIRIEAVDRAGNVTTAELAPVQKASMPVAWPQLASETSRVRPGRAGNTPLASLGTPSPGLFRTRHGDGLRARHTANVLGIFDPTPPTITLRDLPVSLETYRSHVLIEGSAADTTTVASLTVNGAQLLRRKGKWVFFSHLLGLAVGQNRIVVEATDAGGNTRTRELVVERKVLQIRQLGSRMSIALLTLEHQGATSVTGAAVADRLSNAFVAQRRFNLVERARIVEILTELELSGSGLADPRNAPRVGRIVAADAVLAGTVRETDRSLEVVTHLIDTESGIVVATNDAFDEDNSLVAVHQLTERLAFKYQRDFPLLEGRILEVTGDRLLVDLGTEQGLPPHSKLLLFRDTPTSSGRSSGGAPLLLGEARVGTLYPDTARATVTRRDREYRVRDGVLTK